MSKKYYTLAPRVSGCALVDQRKRMKPGDVLPEDYFGQDQLIGLIRRKFIVECEAPGAGAPAAAEAMAGNGAESAATSTEGAVANAGSEPGKDENKEELNGAASTDGTIPAPAAGGKLPADMEINELRTYLTGLNIPYAMTANKAALLKLVPLAPPVA